MTIVDFLLARIAEDEAVANAASGGPWRHDPGKVNSVDLEQSVFTGPTGVDAVCVASTGLDDPQSMKDAAHIARWDPDRVLAECQAKREVIRLHQSWPVLVDSPPEFDPPAMQSAPLESVTFRMTQRLAWLTEQEYRTRFGDEPPTAPILRAMVQVYADHEDFREEWRS